MKKITTKADQSAHDQKRREFVKKSSLAGVGIASAVAIPSVALAGEPEQQPEQKKQKGYQLTAHVADYYKSAAS